MALPSLYPRPSRRYSLPVRNRSLSYLIIALVVGIPAFSGANAPREPVKSPWREWIEPGTPFFSSIIDARRSDEPLGSHNLTPRGLVVHVGENLWAAFDTELLRVSAVWQGPGLTMRSASQVSYHDPGKKAADGQAALPAPAGPLFFDNGLYPGWQQGIQAALHDPRALAPSAEEVGRGPLLESEGRFRALRRTMAGLCLEYSVAGVRVEEIMSGSGAGHAPSFQRTFRMAPSINPLLLVVARKGHTAASPAVTVANGTDDCAILVEDNGTWVVVVRPHADTVTFRVDIGPPPPTRVEMPAGIDRPAPSQWPETVTTSGVLSTKRASYVVDDIDLPLANPWRRNVRLADIQFLPDGRAFAVTFDGDVWAIDGLASDLKKITWRRFASGLHESLSLAVRDSEVFVFDRNGIWRLRDTDADGGADVHELFSNVVAQSADSREYPNGMKLAPDGSFVIVKGGQVDTYFGKHYGSVVRVAPDGRSFSVLGWGFRQPFIGVHPRTGLVTSSDQEGQYVPTTPIQIVEGGQYYGFATRLRPAEQHPAAITEPLTWMPRQVNPSAASQVWLVGAQMGPLNDTLLHLGYNRPEIFSVPLHDRAGKPQAAVMSLSQDLSFAPLSGAVNPKDGQLYVAGFRVFATTAPHVSGLARLRYTGDPHRLPREIVATHQGVLLRFDHPLNEHSADPARFSIERWNYRRTHNYGSSHYKLDGTLGQDRMQPGSVHLSQDHKNIFVALADMQAGVMQMHVSWSLTTPEGAELNSSADFTPWQLTEFRPEQEGFGQVQLSLTPASGSVASQSAPITVSLAEGRRLATFLGCLACHTTDDTSSKGLGPSWKALYGSHRALATGNMVLADEAYLRESIRTPGAKIAKGFENGMPIYAGVASDQQIESLVLYIRSLR